MNLIYMRHRYNYHKINYQVGEVMVIESIQQLKNYFSSLPWYKTIFFPWSLQTKLTKPTMNEIEICVVYSQLHSSWLWGFYNWIFPSLASFSQSTRMRQHRGEIAPENARTSIRAEINELPPIYNTHWGLRNHAFAPMFSSIYSKIYPILVQEPYVNKHDIVELILKEICTNNCLQYQMKEANAFISIVELLKTTFELNQPISFIIDKLKQKSSIIHFEFLNNNLQELCTVYQYNVLDLKILLMGPYAQFVFEILAHAPHAQIHDILRFMTKLEKLSTITEDQKIDFYRIIRGERRSLNITYIEDCLNLYSRLDCVNNPANFSLILKDRSLVKWFAINNILDILNNIDSPMDKEQIQRDFEALTHTDLEGATCYMKLRLGMGISEQDQRLDVLQHNVLLQKIRVGLFKSDMYKIDAYMRENESVHPFDYWVSFVQNLHLLSTSEWGAEYSRGSLLDFFLDSVKKNTEPFVAFTMLMQLHRLNLLKGNLIDMLRYGRSAALSDKCRPFVHELLAVWFGDQALRDLWNSLDGSQFDEFDCDMLIVDCHTILEKNSTNKIKYVRESVWDRLHSMLFYRVYVEGKTSASLNEHIALMPRNIKTLSLRGSVLYYSNQQDLTELFFKLPSNITSVVIHYYNRKSVAASYVEDVIVHDLLWQVQEIITEILTQKNITLNFDSIKFAILIDEIVLSKLIGILEQKNNALAYLTCALLLTGEITNYMDEREGDEIDNHIEKRVHDAIVFYDKAANDNVLKPIIAFFLWHIKTVTDYASVKNKLMQYDVTPSFFCSSYGFFSDREPVIYSCLNRIPNPVHPNMTFKDDPVDLMTTRTDPTVISLIHQDRFLISETLRDIANLFKQVIEWNGEETQQLVDLVGLINYLFAHAMPFERGSAAVSEWLEMAIYKYHGLDMQYNESVSINMEALILPLYEFIAKYPSMIKLEPIVDKNIFVSGVKQSSP